MNKPLEYMCRENRGLNIDVSNPKRGKTQFKRTTLVKETILEMLERNKRMRRTQG